MARCSASFIFDNFALSLLNKKAKKDDAQLKKNLVRDLLTFHIGCPIYLLMYYVLGYCNVEKGRFLLSIKLLSVYSKNNPTTLF